MHQVGMKMNWSCLSEWSPETIVGLDPTPEETALQELEFGTLLPAISICPAELSLAQRTPYAKSAEDSYFIHQDDGIEICSHFLVGQCHSPKLCPKHHTTLPYVWQLRCKDTKTWKSLAEKAQIDLERQYGDPAKGKVSGVYRGSIIKIDLRLLTIQCNRWFHRNRHLSTSSCPMAAFHTVYKYYYEKEHDLWTEYSPDFMKCIEDGLRNDYEEVLFSNGLQIYSLYLVNMVQTKLDTGTQWGMRRRPKFRSFMSQRHRALSVSTISHNDFDTSSGKDNIFPIRWHITNTSLIYEKSTVTCVDSEYIHVYTYFHKTMEESKYTILEISRIQSYFQWEKYFWKNNFMKNNPKDSQYGCLEWYLFHGTSSSNTKAIFKQNFDPRVSGINGTLFSKGSYFARDASYPHAYSPATAEGHHFMFLAKVLVGRPALGNSLYTRPPPLHKACESSLLYDSCVDKAREPTIFIVFDNNQFYPYFIIKYQELQNVVVLD